MKFRLGINYWPITSAMYWWRRFDLEEVEQDFARIRAAGFDSVRIFLLWEDFQPEPHQIAPQMLKRLLSVADLAARHELSLILTLFTGHMSGVNWIPEWALEAGDAPGRFRLFASGQLRRTGLKNWYNDQNIVEAQARLAHEVAAALRAHPALWAYDLGNENSNCVVPSSRAAATAWLGRIAGEIRSADSSSLITIGLHMEDLEEDRQLGPAEAAQVCDFLSMHGYPIYARWAEGPADARLLPFLGLVTRWLGGRDVLFEEFGAPAISHHRRTETLEPTTRSVGLLEEGEAASFTRRALSLLHQFGFLGAMLWCYGDYASALWHEPPLDEAVHERYFGLWHNDYTAKPALAEIKQWVGAERGEQFDDFSWIEIKAADFYLNPRENLCHLYRRFCELQF